MARRYKLVIAAAAVLSVLVAGAAVAATRALSPSQERQAVINDAARQLGVEPQALTNALKQALKNRVDAAVKDGRLTQEQARKLKAGIDAGELPFFGLGPGRLGPGPDFGFRHRGGPGLFHQKLDAAARYLGMTEAQLRDALQDGKTLAQVARDRGKSVGGLVDVLVKDVEKKLDQSNLTEAEKQKLLSGIRDRVTDLVNGRFPAPFRWGFGVDRHRHHVPFTAKFEAAARYLGMTQAQLRDALQEGKTLAQVARDRGKSVGGLVDVLVKDVEKKLDQSNLTEAEKQKLLSGIRDRVTDLVNGRFPEPFHRGFGERQFSADLKRPTIF